MTGHYLNMKLDQAGIGLPDLARRLAISPQALDRLLTLQDISVSILVKIANATGKDVGYFLEGYTPQPSVDYETRLEQTTSQLLQAMQRLLASRDETIAALKQMIQLYESLAKNHD